jgi:hypothetical protein
MLTRPDMILQFAHYLKSVWAERGQDNVRVHAHVEMSLNGRPYQAVVKANVNLADQPWHSWRSPDYVTELTTDFTPWRDRDPVSRARPSAGE